METDYKQNFWNHNTLMALILCLLMLLCWLAVIVQFAFDKDEHKAASNTGDETSGNSSSLTHSTATYRRMYHWLQLQRNAVELLV